MNTTLDTTLDTIHGGVRDGMQLAGGNAMSRRKLLGSALAAAGAAGALSVVSGTTAQAAAPTAAAAPRGFGPPTPAPLMQYLLTTPYRVYDSRSGQAPNGTDPNTGANDTALLRNDTRRIDIAYALGNAADASGVPTTASGVVITVTIVGTTGASGYLKVWSDDVTEPATSVINWDRAGSVVANTVLTGCADGYIQVKCGGATGASTHFIIDVVSYFETLTM